MARFTNSNRHAETEMRHSAERRSKSGRAPETRGYFRRIGFDFAMI